MQFEHVKFTGSIARLEFTSDDELSESAVIGTAYDADGNRIHAHAASIKGHDEAYGAARVLDYYAALLRGEVLVTRVAKEGAPA